MGASAITAAELKAQIEEWAAKVMATKVAFDAPSHDHVSIYETFRMLKDMDKIISDAFASPRYLEDD